MGELRDHCAGWGKINTMWGAQYTCFNLVKPAVSLVCLRFLIALISSHPVHHLHYHLQYHDPSNNELEQIKYSANWMVPHFDSFNFSTFLPFEFTRLLLCFSTVLRVLKLRSHNKFSAWYILAADRKTRFQWNRLACSYHWQFGLIVLFTNSAMSTSEFRDIM